MPPRPKGKVFVLGLEPPSQLSLISDAQQHIAAALAPGANTSRYKREWIIGQTQLNEGVLSGRIGFRGAEGVAEVYDERAKDFREVAVPAGLTAPFAVDLDNLRLAVQPRGGLIKLNGLIGAFRALLGAEGHAWRISIPGHEVSYQAWRKTVARVTHVKLHIRRPNPHWRDTPDIETLLEQAEAEAVRVDLHSDDGLDTDAPFIRQSMVHIEAGYGEAVVTGVREEVSGPRETVYNSAVGSEETAVDLPVSENGEVESIDLARAVRTGGPMAAMEPRDSDTDGDHT